MLGRCLSALGSEADIGFDKSLSLRFRNSAHGAKATLGQVGVA